MGVPSFRGSLLLDEDKTPPPNVARTNEDNLGDSLSRVEKPTVELYRVENNSADGGEKRNLNIIAGGTMGKVSLSSSR